MTPPAIICEAPRAIDGDTLRCAGIGRVRIVAINARELHGPDKGGCKGNAPCPERSAESALANLSKLLRVQPVQLLPLTHDRYGRLVARVRAGGIDVGCAQVAGGFAAEWSRYGKACDDR